MKPLRFAWLGRLAYDDGERLQSASVAARRADEIADTLWLLEHPPVVTLGRNSDAKHVLASAEELAARGIARFETGRGGDVTYHGPGQLVGYPILALGADERDAHAYLRNLEQAMIETVASYGVQAHRVEGLTGIWVGREKLGAIGVRLSTGWITSHGFALNVSTDLAGFETIVPCGIRERGVTSLARLLGQAPPLEEVARRTAGCLGRHLGRRMVAQDADLAQTLCCSVGGST